MLNSTNSEITIEANVTGLIEPGENVIAIHDVEPDGERGGHCHGENLAGSASAGTQFVLTDDTWLASATETTNWFGTDFNDARWGRVFSRGQLGLPPWGDVFQLPKATPAGRVLTLLPGFKAELIRSAEPDEGSWVCMTIDPEGRLIISPQEGVNNLLRVTLTPGWPGEEGGENRPASRLGDGSALCAFTACM